ncbi:anaerobic sulfatase maturase [Acerihabitans arboris]|uniref:Anaerobic sulfatase maturase n=1 Tax=Acerihabitans arboris TaxID=2691583 RepID=A0A845SRW3_9GAMM|nr:anaerobic sulfatase maturase [Acerihabitans arboris]NDL65606.1 anaerobic sulfatase maturase [Acerihabitans arboris]
MKRPFSLMAKPTSYQCNIRCDYCFYIDKKNTVIPNGAASLKHMADDVLREYIKQYIDATAGDEVMFAWQGGEPTLAGIDFYADALRYQQRYARGKRISNSMQTNGVLIDDRWARFLAHNHFLMGISLDGPARLHNAYRHSASGRPVFDKVINAIQLFKQYHIDFNVLAVVNDETARAPLEIYRFITQELGAHYVQFIPAVEQMSSGPGRGELIYPRAAGDKMLTPWSVSGEAYGSFINTLFDYWVRHDVGRVFVQLFDNALAAWSGVTPGLCVMRPTCGQALVAEQNGDIYSCDHFVYPEHKLGNLMTTTLADMAGGKQQRQFGQLKANVAKPCLACEYRFACHGGCPKHRIHRVDGQWHNHLCNGYKAIFSHIAPYMIYMADELAHHRPPAGIMRNKALPAGAGD